MVIGFNHHFLGLTRNIKIATKFEQGYVERLELGWLGLYDIYYQSFDFYHYLA